MNASNTWDAPDNDCNIACFGAFTLGIMHMKRLAEEFLTAECEPGCASQPKVDGIRSSQRK